MNTVRNLKTIRVAGDRSFPSGGLGTVRGSSDYFQTLNMRGVVSSHLLDRRKRVNSRMNNRSMFLKAKNVSNNITVRIYLFCSILRGLFLQKLLDSEL